jgi:D-beta-D-heptose 7-phosphate kinase/D-beta-D-heptose 1-phosphate adenosyltransferase
VPQHLPKTLPPFGDTSILVIGDVLLDRYWFGDTSRVSPEAPVPIVKIASTDNRPGGAGNVALNIAALGVKVTLLGITGKDEAAHLLNEQLSSAGVTHDLCAFDNVKTIIKLRVISRHQQLIRVDFEENMVGINQEILLDRFKKHLSETKLVVLSDYNKGTLADPQRFIQMARKANVPVIVDPKGNDFSIYQHATILTPNRKEFEAVVGVCHSEQDIISKGRELLHKYHLGALLITRGEAGMTLIQADSTAHLPAYAREVFDVTGAGDTVIATLGAAVAAGTDFISATALANLAASIVVSKLGAATVSAPELQVAITGQASFSSGIMNDEQLLQAVNAVRMQGKRIIFTNGCFDILHAGHVTYLQLAKQLGDYLIVGVNDDSSVRKLKGEGRPVNNIEHRMTVLAGLGVVDWVIPFADETPERLLRLLKPDVLVKGGDYHLDQIVGADIVRTYGGDVRIMKHNITTSSTSLLNQLTQYGALQEVVNEG